MEQGSTPVADVPYSEDELNNLREIFNIFDRDGSGKIDSSDIDEIMRKIGKSPEEGIFHSGQNLLAQVDPNHDGQITFEEFIQLLNRVEQQLSEADEPRATKEVVSGEELLPDSKVMDFLRLLEEYRVKCEAENNYGEAKKAREKYDELRKKYPFESNLYFP